MQSREQAIINGFNFQNPQILRGDDAAAITLSHPSLIVSQDTLCEGVHFDLTFCSPEDIAHRVIHANLSDMAAMGLHGEMILQSLAIPKHLSRDWIKKYTHSFNTVMEKNHLTLVGGDICRSMNDLMITITIMDQCPQSSPITRHGAKPGNLIAITKPPGHAALGLEALKRKTDHLSHFKACFLRPSTQNTLAVQLRETGCVRAMLDSSDGLIDSLNHIITQSKVGIHLDLDLLPTSSEFIKACNTLQLDPIQLQLNGGEDYGLVMSIDETLLKQCAPNTVFPIGRVTDDKTLQLTHHGKSYQFDHGGFSHFE